jgi:hypothetical protein
MRLALHILVLALALVGACAILLAALFSGVSWAHEAAAGWSYPFACCSNYDCRETAAVTEGPAGFTVPSGEVVGFSDKRVLNSPDGEFHWCSVAGKDDGLTICLFVPPRSF